jgi:hypothetical protein
MLYLLCRNEEETGSAEVQPARNNSGHLSIQKLFDNRIFRRTQVTRQTAVKWPVVRLSAVISFFYFHAQLSFFHNC